MAAAAAELEHKAKRLQQRLCSRRLHTCFSAWRSIAYREGGNKRLDEVLRPCREILEKPAHARTHQELLPLLQLFDGLCKDALCFIAQHAKVLVLQQGVELSGLRDDADTPKVHSVVCGSVTLLHGSTADAELQGLLQAAQAQWEADEAAAAEERAQQQQLCLQTSAAAPADDGSALVRRNSTLEHCCPVALPSPGVWQRVIAAVSQGTRMQLQSSIAAARSSMASTSTPAQPQQQQQQSSSLHQHKPALSSPALPAVVSSALRAPAGFALTASPDTTLTLSAAEVGQSFSVSKFMCSSPCGDGMLLLTTKAPTTCVAAAAAPDSAAAVLVVSRPVYMEALRLHQERHLAHTLSLLCRVPCLRHAPLKELTRLAAHLKETTYSKGQVILRQGHDASEVHFIIKGTVHLTYTAALKQAAAAVQPYAAGHASASACCAGYAQQPVTGGAKSSDAGGRFSGLAQGLRLEQPSLEPPVVLATRGPGAVLGDDAVRDKRLAVGVVAAEEDGVLTLKVAPQKFLSSLDPLTLRLFGKLRQQQQETLQDALVAAAAAATGLDPSQQQPAIDVTQRKVLLDDVYNSNVPKTLLHPGMVGSKDDGAETAARPAWQSLRGKATCQTSMLEGKQLAAKQQAKQQHHKLAGGAAAGEDGEHADAAWEAQLPAGLTGDDCVGLPQTASVKQLIEVIRDVSEYRKLHHRAVGVSAAAAITAHAATAAARAASASLAGGSTGHNLLLTVPDTSATGTATSAIATAAASVMAAAAMLSGHASGTAAGSSNSSCHTELLESCCVAVVKLQVLPGQATVGMAALSSVLDDVYAACGALAYDEGLQVVRWGPGSFILVAPIDPVCPEAAGVECAADVLLTAAARLEGLMLRAEGTLPMLRLAAGLAHGSSFIDYEAGNFISAVTGKAFAAAECLCDVACSTPSWMLPATSPRSSCSTLPSTSQAVLLVSDGVGALLQSQGCGYSLQATGGSCLLLSARPVLPGSALRGGATSSSSSNGRQQSAQASRATLGPGRHTMLGLGLGTAGLLPATPKTPGSHRRAGGSSYGAAQANMRRRIRRKFEAMASFLAAAGDTLPPPPEHMLTQPPPPASGFLGQRGTFMGSSFAAGSAAAAAAAAATTGRTRAVNFAMSEGPTNNSSSSGSSNNAGGGRMRPKLSISLDATGAMMDDGPKPGGGCSSKAARATSSSSSSPTSGGSCRGSAPSAGIGGHAGKQQSSSGRDHTGAAAAAAIACSTVAACQQPDSQPGTRSKRQAQHKQGASCKAGGELQHDGGVVMRHGSITAGIMADGTRSSTAGHSSAGQHTQLAAAAASSCSGSSSGSSGSSSLRLRQQVWQEVQALKAAGIQQGSSLSGGSAVTAALAAAARHSAAELSSVGAWGGGSSSSSSHHRQGSASWWGPSGSEALPPRVGSPHHSCSIISLLSPGSSRPGSPLLSLPVVAVGAEAGGRGMMGASGAGGGQGGLSGTAACQLGGGGTGSFNGGSSSIKWNLGPADLLSLTDGVTSCAAAGPFPHVAAAVHHHGAAAPGAGAAHFKSTGDRAVCFLTPRTQAHQAARHLSQGYRPASPGAAAGHHAATLPAAHGSASGASVAAGYSGDGSGDKDPQQQQQQQQNAVNQQQQWLVQCACKALGSGTAAEAFVAALPANQQLVNFSASGLVQLPSLHALTQLEVLTASFNKLTALMGLLPACPEAAAAAATAAAAAAVAAAATEKRVNTQQSRNTASAASSRPGTAGSAASALRQQHDNSGPAFHQRPASANSTTEAVIFDNTYEHYMLQLMVHSSTVSTLPANLLQLQLSHNSLTALPFELAAALPALTLLDVSHNRLQALPPTIGGLSCLTGLFVGHNQLQQLPGCISMLQALHTLHADHNQLTSLPASIQQLSSLARLHLQHNLLQQLPNDFTALTGLSSLGLGSNNLQQLPQGLLQELCSLRCLDLSGNELTDAALQHAAAPPVNKQQQASSRPGTGTAARGNTPTCGAPASGRRCCSPCGADSTAGPLAEAPGMLLPNLSALDISHNRLQQLPLWLPASLVWLSAAHNWISEVLVALCVGLAGGSLQGLELQGNLLTALPSDLKGISKLQLLGLSGNPGLHPDVVDQGTGLSWAYKWLADKKQATASAALRIGQLDKKHGL